MRNFGDAGAQGATKVGEDKSGRDEADDING